MPARRFVIVMLAILVAAFTLPHPALAEEDIPQVAGKMWLQTAAPLKRSYLIGVSNLLGAEYDFQKAAGFPPDNQSTIRQVAEYFSDVSLDECIARIDAWYKANASKQETTVLAVVWLDMVEPNLPENLPR